MFRKILDWFDNNFEPIVAFLVICIIISVMSIGLGYGEEASLERHTYVGKVTAMESTDTWTKVWLNSEPTIIKIQGDIELVLGEEYEIIIDGNCKLINARIVE